MVHTAQALHQSELEMPLKEDALTSSSRALLENECQGSIDLVKWQVSREAHRQSFIVLHPAAPVMLAGSHGRMDSSIMHYISISVLRICTSSFLIIG